MLHFLLFLLFVRLGFQHPPKNWVVVFDKLGRQPIGRAITRIYDKQYNKLLESRVTDSRGRYAFLVNHNVYYVTAEHQAFQKVKTSDIDLVNQKKEAIVNLDIGLKKQTSNSLPINPNEPATVTSQQTVNALKRPNKTVMPKIDKPANKIKQKPSSNEKPPSIYG